MTRLEAHTQLETIVDAIGLSELLDNLADVCYEKGIHLRENWQDEASAIVWDSAGQRIQRIAASPSIKWA